MDRLLAGIGLVISLFISSHTQALTLHDDEQRINFDETRAHPLDLLANDSGAGPLKVVAVGDVTQLGSDGGYWSPLSSGGFVWVSPEGFAVVFPMGEFAQMPFGESLVSSVQYTVEDSAGVQSRAWLNVTVANLPQEDTPTFINYSDQSPSFHLLDNDADPASLTVTRINNRGPNRMGYFWVAGSNGGYFWIDIEGNGYFFHQGAFSHLPIGTSATSSVGYTVRHANGKRARSQVTVTVINTGTEAERASYRAGMQELLEHPQKVGIGGWKGLVNGYENVPGENYSAPNYYQTLNPGWYYNWDPNPLAGMATTEFVPMIWGIGNYYFVDNIDVASEYDTILAFNEPDHHNQSNVGVGEAIAHWPQLEATGARLGAPAPANDVLDDDSWLAEFMISARARDFKVDFLPLHTYTTNTDVGELEAYLIAAYEKYGLPLWVTEFALADFTFPRDEPRFSQAENAQFLKDSYLMLDDLPFVERQAWFAPLDGGDSWFLNSNFVDSEGDITPVGRAYAEVMDIPVIDYEFIVHKPTGGKIQSCELEIETPVLSTDNSADWHCVQWHRVGGDDGDFHLTHRYSGHYLAPAAEQDGSTILLQPNSWTGDWTRWFYRDTGDGFGHIEHKMSGKYVFLSAEGSALELQPSSWDGDYTRWQFELAQ